MATLNHLASETSPYLLQHAHNPVDWYPWNSDSLAKAKRENKPILLSIGYAACHWCHVMAHESFEDEATAKLMNKLFVNIKVDREERPDLDKIYQSAHYFLTQSQGGWPLTLFLTPDDLTPFFSGTYFPKEKRHNLPTFKQVLETIADIYNHHPDDIKQQNQRLLAVLNEETSLKNEEELSEKPFQTIQTFLDQKFDKKYGGFGGAPKFPHPPILEFLLREKSPMAYFSLEKMAEGGIYDQVGGGFFRYSVDAAWEIPHFEKMLYDNAQLLYLYALASHVFESAFFASIADETANWVVEIMQSPEGGYFSSLDADSEGEEGKYYVWNKFEIAEILTEKEFNFAERYFGLTREPNFENGWHLHIRHTLGELMESLSLDQDEAKELLTSIKTKLQQTRSKRTPPGFDTKILTAWNGLMIKAMLVTGQIVNQPRYIDSAFRALEFIYNHLWKNNLLYVSYKDGRTSSSGYLDDYAFMLDALLTALQTSWITSYLTWATQLADTLIAQFSDPKGGFYFTGKNQERVLFRPKTMMDEAIPSGNAIAARALIMLGRLLNNDSYIEAGESALKAAWFFLVRFPSEHTNFLLALDELLHPSDVVIVRGPVAKLKEWQEAVKSYDPKRQFYFIPENEAVSIHLGSNPKDGKVHAVMCKGTQCLPEVNTLDQFKKLITMI